MIVFEELSEKLLLKDPDAVNEELTNPKLKSWKAGSSDDEGHVVPPVATDVYFILYSELL